MAGPANSPLSRGLPFFVLMTAGTFVLSLFVQTRYDHAVRAPNLRAVGSMFAGPSHIHPVLAG